MPTFNAARPSHEGVTRRASSAPAAGNLGEHDVFTVSYEGWSGLKNGELLSAAENDGFEVFVTGDQTLSYEQNLARRRIALVVLSSIEWHILKNNLSLIVAAIDSATPASFQTVECGTFSRKKPPGN